MIQAGNSFSIPGIAKKSPGEHRRAFGRKTCFNSKLICYLRFQFHRGLKHGHRAFLGYRCLVKSEIKAAEAFFSLPVFN